MVSMIIIIYGKHLTGNYHICQAPHWKFYI
jgi:hypothetical protein